MKTFIFSTLAFGTGLALGAVVSHKMTKKKYLNIADEEVRSVKESLEKYYAEKNDCKEKNIEVKNTTKEDNPILGKDSIDYDSLKNNKEQYIKYTKTYKPIKKEENKEETPKNIDNSKPYVLSPEEFADGENDVQSLVWYSDGVLADDEFNIIKDVNGYVGDEALNTFGMYEEDTVYVRNENHGIDYEILLDNRRYSDAAPKGTIAQYPGDDE